MASSGRVPLSAVFHMLEGCAPGHKRKKKKHRWWVLYQEQTFRGLPTGEHGASDPEIEIGHIKKMARFFDILECAKGKIEALK